MFFLSNLNVLLFFCSRGFAAIASLVLFTVSVPAETNALCGAARGRNGAPACACTLLLAWYWAYLQHSQKGIFRAGRCACSPVCPRLETIQLECPALLSAVVSVCRLASSSSLVWRIPCQPGSTWCLPLPASMPPCCCCTPLFQSQHAGCSARAALKKPQPSCST